MILESYWSLLSIYVKVPGHFFTLDQIYKNLFLIRCAGVSGGVRRGVGDPLDTPDLRACLEVYGINVNSRWFASVNCELCIVYSVKCNVNSEM